MKIYRKVNIIILMLCLSIDLLAVTAMVPVNKKTDTDHIQDEIMTNFIFSDNIKTVQLFPEGWELGYPVIDINDNTPLVFSFDDFSDESKSYSYTIIHCGSDWIPTGILQSDYISGFNDAIINDYEFSRNTLRNYIHYTLKIPNEDIRPTLAGNYILMVYEDFDRDKPVITSRFYVVDYRVEIEGEAKRTDDLQFFNTDQEVDFTIYHDNLTIDDPGRNIKVTILQNNSSLNAITNLKPRFVHDNALIYNYEEENRFPGLSEFRYFDTKDLKYLSDRLARIVFERPYQHAYLLPDPIRSLDEYDFFEDLNGNYFIRWDEGSDSRIDADYVNMHFTLPFESALPGASVYVYGALSSWNLLPQYKMEYNLSTRAYELVTPLKQGLYNYQYVFVPDRGENDFAMFEGSHFETENDYLVFVYHKDFRNRYETLVGFKVFNTVEKGNR